MPLTRVFKSGNSQAVRIPAELAYADMSIDLQISRMGDVITIFPARGSMKDAVAALRAMPKPPRLLIAPETGPEFVRLILGIFKLRHCPVAGLGRQRHGRRNSPCPRCRVYAPMWSASSAAVKSSAKLSEMTGSMVSFHASHSATMPA